MTDEVEVPGATEAQARINRTRAELETTLGTIEDKLNVKKQYARLSDRAQVLYREKSEQAKASYREKPVPWIVGATAVGILVLGTVAWAIFSDD
jgi:hypothetical protein